MYLDKICQMNNHNDLSDLKRYARDRIDAQRYPNDAHIFHPKKCPTCGVVPLELMIEHHSGSKANNFRGIIFGTCTECNDTARIFSFTGEHRTPEREEKPMCRCGSTHFLVGECERIEREEGLLGFFDEGVVVGKCAACGDKRAFVYTD